MIASASQNSPSAWVHIEGIVNPLSYDPELEVAFGHYVCLVCHQMILRIPLNHSLSYLWYKTDECEVSDPSDSRIGYQFGRKETGLFGPLSGPNFGPGKIKEVIRQIQELSAKKNADS